MAFPAVSGYGNLPNGNWSPIIYSKKAQIAFRKTSVIQAITNTDYFGEIKDAGDTVKIIKEPDIVVQPYLRGSQITAQDLDDEEITLTVDKANYFAFKVDDIESKQSHIEWESLASNRAGYKLANQMDKEVLNYITTQIPSGGLSGTTSSPIEIGYANSRDFSPLNMIARFQRWLNENDVPTENRWFVADPYFYELLSDENSKVLDDDYTTKGILRNGLVASGQLRGFQLYQSNNLRQAGNGPEGSATTDYGFIMAGHMSAVASAEQINKTETYRDPDSFADVVRGMHLYGRKVLRTDAVVGAVYHSAT